MNSYLVKLNFLKAMEASRQRIQFSSSVKAMEVNKIKTIAAYCTEEFKGVRFGVDQCANLTSEMLAAVPSWGSIYGFPWDPFAVIVITA